jgi:hypothetical protein
LPYPINVFETKPEQQQALIDQWIRFTESVKDEPGMGFETYLSSSSFSHANRL